jgi:GTPase SAR1 family protein
LLVVGCSASKPVNETNKKTLPAAPKRKPSSEKAAPEPTPKPEETTNNEQPAPQPAENPQPTPVQPTEQPTEQPAQAPAEQQPAPQPEPTPATPAETPAEPPAPQPEPTPAAPAETPAENPPPAEPPVENPPEQPAETPHIAVVTDPNATQDSFGLLLCGAGESGKTTFTRQLKLRFLGGFKEEDRSSFVATIRGNLIDTIQILLVWLEKHDQSVDESNAEAAEEVSGLDAFNCDFTIETTELLKQLWEDPNVQNAFSHRDETAVPDHMDYFFEKIDELADEGYVPTDEDVLRARIRSIGVEAITFDIDNALTTFYDVGGQKNERSKWETVTDKVAGVVFCVSFAEYDKPMFEDPDTLRINDALEIFRDLTHRPQFDKSPFFLIANKIDVFNQKIANTDTFVKIFPDYTGDPHNQDDCANFLVQKFIDAAAPARDDRPIDTFKLSALNADQVVETSSKICKFISDKYFE